MEFSVSPVLSETRWRFMTRWDMPGRITWMAGDAGENRAGDSGRLG
jgi:hypothetical protein